MYHQGHSFGGGFYLAAERQPRDGIYFCLNGFYIYTICFSTGLMSRMFTNGPEDRGSTPGRVKPKTQETVLDAALLSNQHYKVRIKGKEGQSWEWSCALP